MRSAASRWRSPSATARASAGARQLDRALRLARGRDGEREVVQRGRLGGVVARRLGERERLLEVAHRLGAVAAARGEDAEDVVRLRARAQVAGLLGQRQRRGGELGRLGLQPAAVGGEAAVGRRAGGRRALEAVERGGERGLGQLPLAAAQVEDADPVLDLAAPAPGPRAPRRPGSSRARAP